MVSFKTPPKNQYLTSDPCNLILKNTWFKSDTIIKPNLLKNNNILGEHAIGHPDTRVAGNRMPRINPTPIAKRMTTPNFAFEIVIHCLTSSVTSHLLF